MISFIKIFGLSSPRIFVLSPVSACRQGMANSQSVVPLARGSGRTSRRGESALNLVPPPPLFLPNPGESWEFPGNPGSRPGRTPSGPRLDPLTGLSDPSETLIFIEKVEKRALFRDSATGPLPGALLINVFFGWEWTGSQKDLASKIGEKNKFGPEKLDPYLPKKGPKTAFFHLRCDYSIEKTPTTAGRNRKNGLFSDFFSLFLTFPGSPRAIS